MLPFGSTAITLTTGTLWLSSEWSRALMIHPALCFKVEHIIQFRWIRLGKAESIYSRLHSACFFFPPLLIAGPFDAMSAFREPNLKLGLFPEVYTHHGNTCLLVRNTMADERRGVHPSHAHESSPNAASHQAVFHNLFMSSLVFDGSLPVSYTILNTAVIQIILQIFFLFLPVSYNMQDECVEM